MKGINTFHLKVEIVIKLTKKNGITLEVRLYLEESMEFNI